MWLAALLLALAVGGCLAGKVHPGKSLLKRRCSSCHTPRSREQVRARGLDRVLADHGGKIKVKPAELKQIRAYIQGPPARSRKDGRSGKVVR